MPGNQRRYPLGGALDYLPRMGDTAGGLIGPTSCSCSLIQKTSALSCAKQVWRDLVASKSLSLKIYRRRTDFVLRPVDLVGGLS
jgi:hypothetical protein